MSSPKGKMLRSDSGSLPLLEVRKIVSVAKDEIIQILENETSKINMSINSLSDRIKTLEKGVSAIEAKQKSQEDETSSLKHCLENLPAPSPTSGVGNATVEERKFGDQRSGGGEQRNY